MYIYVTISGFLMFLFYYLYKYNNFQFIILYMRLNILSHASNLQKYNNKMKHSKYNFDIISGESCEFMNYLYSYLNI